MTRARRAIDAVIASATVLPAERPMDGVTFAARQWAALELLTLDAPGRQQVKRAMRSAMFDTARVPAGSPCAGAVPRDFLVACALVRKLDSLRTRQWDLRPDGTFRVLRDAPRFRDGL